MSTRGLGTACRPADATLIIAPGAACRLVVVIDIAGQSLRPLSPLAPLPPPPLEPPP
jgi:hypothetical protein